MNSNISDEKGDIMMIEQTEDPLSRMTELESAPELEEHKVTFKALLVVLAVDVTYIAQLLNVVGTGAYASQISLVVGGSATSVWLAACVAILTAALGPPICAASDLFGRKWLLVILTMAGCVGTIIVARAPSMNITILGEVIAGMSYGAQPLIHAVPSEIIPRKYRPYAQASVNGASATGGLLALLMGAALMRADPAQFRTYFAITAGFYAFSALLIFVLYNPPPRHLQLSLTTKEKLRRLDWVAFALFASSLVLFCMGLSWAGNPYAWSDPHVLAPLITGIVILGALVVHQLRFRKDGLFHHRLFSMGRNFPLSIICVFVEGLTFFCANGYFAFQIGVEYETDLFKVVLPFAMAFIAFMISGPIAAYICSRTRTVRPVACLAYLAFVGFYVAMALAGPSSGKAVYGYAVMLGIGLGFCLCALMTAAQLTTPPDLIATASGLMISMRSLGGSVGLAVASAAFNSKLNVSLPESIAEAILSVGLPPSSVGQFIGALLANDTPGLLSVPGVSPAIIGAGVEGLKNGFNQAFRVVWIMGASFASVGFICAAILKDPKDQYTNAVDAPIEKEEAELSAA